MGGFSLRYAAPEAANEDLDKAILKVVQTQQTQSKPESALAKPIISVIDVRARRPSCALHLICSEAFRAAQGDQGFSVTGVGLLCE